MHFHKGEDGEKSAHLSFSSDASEVCEDDTHLEKKTLKNKMQRRFWFSKENQEKKKTETKPLTHK